MNKFTVERLVPLLLFFLLSCCQVPHKQKKIHNVVLTKRTHWTELRSQSQDLIKSKNLSYDSEIHFFDSENKLVAFYRQGTLHKMTDYGTESVIKLYHPSDFSEETLRDKKILDLGCGANGHLVRGLRAHGYDVTGIDLFISDSLKSDYLVKGDITKMPFKNDSFDLFFATYVLFKPLAYDKDFVHRSLKDILRVSRDGAKIFISPVELTEQEARELLKPFPQLEFVSLWDLNEFAGDIKKRLAIKVHK